MSRNSTATKIVRVPYSTVVRCQWHDLDEILKKAQEDGERLIGVTQVGPEYTLFFVRQLVRQIAEASAEFARYRPILPGDPLFEQGHA